MDWSGWCPDPTLLYPELSLALSSFPCLFTSWIFKTLTLPFAFFHYQSQVPQNYHQVVFLMGIRWVSLTQTSLSWLVSKLVIGSRHRTSWPYKDRWIHYLWRPRYDVLLSKVYAGLHHFCNLRIIYRYGDETKCMQFYCVKIYTYIYTYSHIIFVNDFSFKTDIYSKLLILVWC